MSQASGMAGGGFTPNRGNANNKAIPVLLLALAVALGVGLLHGLDDSPTATEASLANQTTATTVAVATTVTPTTVAARTPSEVKVLVLNGTSVSGVAARLNSTLQPIGYQLGSPTNTTAPTAQTSVQYAAGYEAEAQAVAESLDIDTSLVRAISTPAPAADVQNSNVVVVIGDTLAASANTAAGNSASDSTTATTSANATNGQTASTTTAAPTTTTAAANAGLNGPLGSVN